MKLSHAQRCKDRYVRLKASGICIKCGSKDADKGVMCESCAERSLKSSSRCFEKSKRDGRCYTCGNQADRDLAASCRDCHEKRLVYSGIWEKDNQDRINAGRRHRWRSDRRYRLARLIRTRFGSVFRRYIAGAKKTASAVKDLGCTLEQLCEHLESKFQPGMTWANYGNWHIDHIRPLDSFDLTDPSQQKEAVNFKNLQPLWAKDNLSKGCRLDN